MTHHLIATQPHTHLAMSYVGPYATVNILPDSGITRIAVSHAADVTEDQQYETATRIINMSNELSDPDNKGPFINLVTNTFDAYIAPADYRTWSEEDQGALMRTAAKTLNQFLGH